MQITYTTHSWDDERGAYLAEAVATVQVDDHGATTIEGDPRYVDLDLSVMDLGRGRPVSFKEDPTAWATNLWTAYRTPDLTVEVSGLAAEQGWLGDAAELAGVAAAIADRR
jgi:hypothetical protein